MFNNCFKSYLYIYLLIYDLIFNLKLIVKLKNPNQLIYVLGTGVARKISINISNYLRQYIQLFLL